VTIRSRLTIWYGLTFMLLIGIAGVAVWWQVQASLRASTEEALRIHAADVASELGQGGTTVHALEPPYPEIFTALEDPSSGSLDPGPGTPPNLPLLPQGASSRRLTDEGPTFAFYAMTLPDGRVLIIGSSLASVERSAARLPELLMVIGTLCALGSLVGGWWLAGRALAPMRRLTREADAIGPHELGRRLPDVDQRDEVGRLAATLNRLLARIEESVNHERAFITGAAHDLRTPIAALRMQLDMLLRGGLVGQSARPPVEDARRDVDDLAELADALLGLAEAQAKGLDDAMEDQVLPMLVSRAEQEVEWLARERAVRIEGTVDETTARISAVRFHQALVNLLSNAVRHGLPGGAVELTVRIETDLPGQGAVVMVEVADRGPGIEVAMRDSIFVPFALRRSASTTHGLGLATAAAAVASQAGQIGYRDRPGGGSVFWFWLPIAPRAEAARGNERPHGGGSEG
jgi:two-component system OmpR family sensor kinase